MYITFTFGWDPRKLISVTSLKYDGDSIICSTYFWKIKMIHSRTVNERNLRCPCQCAIYILINSVLNMSTEYIKFASVVQHTVAVWRKNTSVKLRLLSFMKTTCRLLSAKPSFYQHWLVINWIIGYQSREDWSKISISISKYKFENIVSHGIFLGFNVLHYLNTSSYIAWCWTTYHCFLLVVLLLIPI